MKKYLILLFSFIITFTQAQDLIITSKNDSIKCKITSIEYGVIHYSSNDKSQKDGFFGLSNIKKYEYDYLNKNTPNHPMMISKETAYPQFRITIQGGYSYNTTLKYPANSDELYISHKKNLQTGFHIGADGVYYFSSFFGAGGKFNYFMTNSSIKDLEYTEPSGTTTKIDFKEDVSVIFAGPMLSFRYLHNKNKNAMILNTSAGYISYKNSYTAINTETYTGNTFGICIDLGYDIAIYKTIYIGVQGSFLMGSLSKVSREVATGSIEEPLSAKENLSRFDLSAGLRFYF